MGDGEKNPATGGVFIGIGANLVAEGFASPRETCMAAIGQLAAHDGVGVVKISPWYKTAPVPVSDQPWFSNAVVELATRFDPEGLLAVLHECEGRYGRTRKTRNEARVLDLDIVDMAGMVRDEAGLTLPHPRMHERAFVLYPLADLAPGWRHPRTGETVEALIAGLAPGQEIVADGEGD